MRAARAALVGLALAAGAARGQVPSDVSPRLARAWARPDTTVLVWVIARRETDLDALAARVRDAGGTVRHQSRFVWAVSAAVPGSTLPLLARLPGVRRVQPVGVYYRPKDETHGRGGTGAAALAPACAVPPCPRAPVPAAARAPSVVLDTTYGPGAWAQQQLDIPAVQALGDSGAGVKIAMLDAGFDTSQAWVSGAHVLLLRDFDGRSGNSSAHGTATFSLLAAHRLGSIVGAAPAAEYFLATTEYTPSETRIEEDHWVAAVEVAESLGVDIISSSLGYLSFDGGFTYTYAQLNGDVGVTTIAADSAAARGTLVVVAMGNNGPLPGSLDTPADAKGIVSVGAVDSGGAVASFSSRGPTSDGRTKPEVVGPGVGVFVAVSPATGAFESGTSFATPLVAGVAALVQGTRLGQPASALRRGLLDASSARYAPDDNHGWGVPDALKLLAFPTGFEPLGPLDSNLTAITPTFAWDAGTPPFGASDTVRLQVALDTGFATVVLDTTVTAASAGLPRAAAGGTRLWWRATARSSLGASESIARIGPLVVPPWVTLLTLDAPSGASIGDSQPVFAWHAPQVTSPPGPETFDLNVFPASGGPTVPVLMVRGLTDTTYRPTTPLEKNLPFKWQIVAHVGTDSAIVTSAGTFLVLDQAAPATTVLFQNFPNPFPNRALGVATSCIWFDIATAGTVRLEIFDVRGRLVRRLVPSAQVDAQFDPGRYGRPAGNAPGTCDTRFAWDGRDETGAYARPGVYLYRLTAPGFQDTKRIVFLGAP
ncbi:MAG TPA: S8 family serine peptidase [Gemmatimonadales bacterium]|nr:S8 family serine peptidase [Gemmatimonadales bacterium]